MRAAHGNRCRFCLHCSDTACIRDARHYRRKRREWDKDAADLPSAPRRFPVRTPPGVPPTGRRRAAVSCSMDDEAADVHRHFLTAPHALRQRRPPSPERSLPATVCCGSRMLKKDTALPFAEGGVFHLFAGRRRNYMRPCSIMLSATLRKPAMLPPIT